MSFTPPNHARALFWGLSCTWLYIASVVWFCVLTVHPIDPISLATGGVSAGLLVYGATVIHRAMVVNAVPLGFSFYDGVWGLAGGAAAMLQIAASLVLLFSCLAIVWTIYHSHRDKLTLERGLPIAFLLALPLLIHELSRQLLGVNVYEAIFGGLMGLLH